MYGVLAIPLIVGVSRPSRPRPWVARLSLTRWRRFDRDFVRPVYDYTGAAKSGRGTVAYFNLAPGVYEVYRATSWRHERRYFVRVTGAGVVSEIEREEAIACLRNADWA